MNPLELQLRYNSPQADSWYVSVTSAMTLDDTDLLLTKTIIKSTFAIILIFRQFSHLSLGLSMH